MKIELNSRYFIASFLLHVGIVILCGFLCNNNRIAKNFLVHGAHSSTTGKTLYKKVPLIVPFVHSTSQPSKKTGTQQPTRHQQTHKQIQPLKKVVLAEKITPPINKQPKITATAPPKPLKKVIPTAPTRTAKNTRPATGMQPMQPQQKNAAEKVVPVPPVPKPTPEVLKKTVNPREQKKNIQEKSPVAPVAQKLQPLPEPEAAPALTVAETLATDQPYEEFGQGNATDKDEIMLDFSCSDTEKSTTQEGAIKSVFKHSWHPPLGVPRGTEATIRLTLDGRGRVASHVFVRKSQIPIYDMSIVRAYRTMQFPPWGYNQSITITLRQ